MKGILSTTHFIDKHEHDDEPSMLMMEDDDDDNCTFRQSLASSSASASASAASVGVGSYNNNNNHSSSGSVLRKKSATSSSGTRSIATTSITSFSSLHYSSSVTKNRSKSSGSSSNVAKESRVSNSIGVSSNNRTTTNKVLQELNQLKFESLGLYGRDVELDILHHVYTNLGIIKQQGQQQQEGQQEQQEGQEKSEKGNNDEAKEEEGEEKRRKNNTPSIPTQETAIIWNQTTTKSQTSTVPPPPFLNNMILLSGESGTGKSAIVKEFTRRIQKRQQQQHQQRQHHQQQLPHHESSSSSSFCISVSGKFDQHHRGVSTSTTIPYRAFVTAFSQLCSILIQQQQQQQQPQQQPSSPRPPPKEQQYHHSNNNTTTRTSTTTTIQLNDIVQAVGKDYKLLLDLIPNLGELIYEAKNQQATTTTTTNAAITPPPATAAAATTTTISDWNTTSSSSLPSPEDDDDKEEEGYDIVKSGTKFKFLIQRFLHAICKPAEHNNNNTKLILFLDDVQWIDTASLELLEIIMTDPILDDCLLLICAYRDNEMINDEHPFRQRLKRILNKRNQNHQQQEHPQQEHPQMMVVRNLTIQNLSPDMVHSYITDLFNCTSLEESKELAQIVYQRVNGNFFFLRQFLTSLRDEGYIQYNVGSMKWIWDNESMIRKHTVVSGNVLTIIMNKLERQSSSIKRILQIAACLGGGSSWLEEIILTIIARDMKYSNLLLLVEEEDATPTTTSTTAATATATGPDEEEKESSSSSKKGTTTTEEETTETTLDLIVEEGFLERFLDPKSGTRSYCFAHDQIELAANALLDEDSLPELKLEIGRILHNNRTKFDYQGLLFVIVDLWNDGREHITGRKAIRFLIDLNYAAGKKALESCAFEAAVIYLRNAIALLPKNKQWATEDYDISLQLYNSLIKAEYCNGSWENLDGDIEVILAQKDRPVLDKMVAYSTMITRLSFQQHNHGEAIGLAVDVLGKLGSTFRPNLGMLAVVGALIKTKQLLRKYPLESLLEKEDMKDDHKSAALDVITAMNSSMYAASPELLLCTVLKTLRWSLKYGVTKYTSKCIGFYALLEMAMGNTESASNAAKLAQRLAEQQNLMTSEYAPISSAYGFVLPWTNSLHMCGNALLNGYKIGIETGDLEFGFMNIVLFCFFCFCAGKPFSDLEADMRDYGRQMKEYEQSLQLQFLCLTWQTILNLMGRGNKDPLILTGDAMNQEEMLQAADDDKNPPLRAQVQCHRLQLAVYFGDFKLAGKLIGLASNIAAVNPGNPIIWRTALFEGVAAFELVRQGGRKWKGTALKALSKVQKWVDAGNVNCVHILHLLQAEKAAMGRDIEGARKLFDKAIVTAARNGFRNDRALSSERCAQMYELVGDDFWVKDYLEKAYEAYEEMEAFGKLDQMKKVYQSLRPSLDIDIGGKEVQKMGKPGSGRFTVVTDPASIASLSNTGVAVDPKVRG